MTITLPDDPALEGFSEADIRLDLACALFASRRISRTVAARLAGMDRSTFDDELFHRRIPSYTEEMLEEDMETSKALFAK